MTIDRSLPNIVQQEHKPYLTTPTEVIYEKMVQVVIKKTFQQLQKPIESLPRPLKEGINYSCPSVLQILANETIEGLCKKHKDSIEARENAPTSADLKKNEVIKTDILENPTSENILYLLQVSNKKEDFYNYISRRSLRELQKREHDGNSLFDLIMKNTPELFDLLWPILKGFDVDYVFLAARANNGTLLKHLLNKNFVYQKQNNQGETPLARALASNNAIAAEILVKHAIKENTLIELTTIISNGSTDLLQLYFDSGLKVDASLFFNLILSAAEQNQLEVMKKLLFYAGDTIGYVDIKEICFAVIRIGHINIVSELLNHGLRVDQALLREAAKHRQINILGLLLKQLEQSSWPENSYFEKLRCVFAVLNKDSSKGIFQIRQKDWNVPYGGDESQEKYERYALNAVFQSLKKSYDFEEVMEHLAFKRHQVAQYLNHATPLFFGLRRDIYERSLKTPICARYQTYGDQLWNLNINENQKYLLNAHKNDALIKGQIVLKFSDNLIPLTKFWYNNETKKGMWEHTSWVYFKKLLPLIKNQYQTILDVNPKNILELSYEIGRIHWLLSQASLYGRGSAAITDWLTKFLWAYHKVRVSPWKKGCIPDCEALTTPNPEYFAAMYLSFMEETPKRDKTVIFSPFIEKFDILAELTERHELDRLRGLLPKLLVSEFQSLQNKLLQRFISNRQANE